MAALHRLAARIAARIRDWWQHQLVAAILLVVCAVIALAAIGFAMLAVFLALRVAMPIWAAALATAGGLLILALIAGAIANRYAREPLPEPRQEAPRPGAEAPVELAAQMGRTLGENLSRRGVRSTDVVIAAMLAGLALGAAPALRERLGREKEGRGEDARTRRR